MTRPEMCRVEVPDVPEETAGAEVVGVEVPDADAEAEEEEEACCCCEDCSESARAE